MLGMVLVTWVFDDGFVPSAKLTNEGNYSIVPDYLGTPVEANDENGEKVWSAELDIYGRVKEFAGDVDFVPFRYQGQYEDVETGLYYNRFRYYDPAIGQYAQQDPIGLAGSNPTLYGYVRNTNCCFDPFGLTWQIYDVGRYDLLRDKIGKSGRNVNAHHVGQARVMEELIPSYVRKTGPAIILPGQGHTFKVADVRVLSRATRGFTSPRDLLARDSRELRRVYSDIPNSKLKELIELNKNMYPEVFKKCR